MRKVKPEFHPTLKTTSLIVVDTISGIWYYHRNYLFEIELGRRMHWVAFFNQKGSSNL